MKKQIIPSSKLWHRFGTYFPYSVVDVIILDSDNRFLLTRRAIKPYKGKWHLPGGTIYKNISMKKTAKIVAKKEVNLDVTVEKFIGVYEVKHPRHDISHAFLARVSGGNVKLDFQSTEARFFRNPPRNIIPHQRRILAHAKSLLRTKTDVKKINFTSKVII